MLGHVRGKRSAVTCALKCDNACASAVCNTSQNNYLRDIVSAEFSRRNLLGAGAVGAAALLLGGAGAQSAEASTLSPAAKVHGGGLPFTPIEPVPYVVDG